MISVSDLTVRFGRAAPVVDGISFDVAPGECFAIVGQSGSGKSVTARSLLGLSGGTVSGSVFLDSVDLVNASARQWRSIRGKEIGFVSQGALVALDPLRTVGREVGDALRLHTSLSAVEQSARIQSLLSSVGIPDPSLRASQRADELSGGLRQRAIIASAIALQPRFLIADEPTTALDSTVAAGILDLLESLRASGTGILLISHDLATVSRLASRVAVMQGGRIVESGTVDDVLRMPRHPYTRQLIAAVPAGTPRHAPLAPPPRVGNSGPGAAAPPAQPSPAVSARPGPSFPTMPPATGPRVGNEGPGAANLVAEPAVEHPGAPGPEFSTTVLAATGLVRRFGPRLAVDDVGFQLERGRTLGIVGESGSGKTTVARLVLALDKPDAGTVELFGRPWAGRDRREARIGAIYQDALSSFDPRLTVGQILSDAQTDGRSRRADVSELLELVGLDPSIAARRPRILSGGQQQRVSIARAIAPSPAILVCDEPVSSLDVIAQAQVLDLLDKLQRELGMSYLFISHDLGVIRHMSDDVLVMRDGRVLESGPTEDVFGAPQHDYTRALIAAAPTLD